MPWTVNLQVLLKQSRVSICRGEYQAMVLVSCIMFKFDQICTFLNCEYVRSSSWTTLDKLFSITITCVIKNQGLFLAIQFEPSCTTKVHGNLSCKDKSTLQRTESDPKVSFAIARLSGELWTALAVAFQQKLYTSEKYDWHATSRSQIGVNCNMCIGKSATSSDATPAIIQSVTSLPWLVLLVLQMQKSVCGKFLALHLCLHLHPDWHWPSPFRSASRIALWHLLAIHLCSTSHTGPAYGAWRFCCAGYKRSKCNPTGTSEIELLGSLPRWTCPIAPHLFRHQSVLPASFPETPDWRSHLRSLLGLCTMTACHNVSTGTKLIFA